MPEAAFDRRIVSVLFADIVGFTPLSESLDPEDVATVQDAYFAATRETIERYGGVLEKFIGDAAVAVFGVPRARDDDGERAVRAGLALLGAIEQINARLGLEPGTLQLRVGVNTGEVVYATAGPDQGRVTGDTVNTAARYQAAARPGTVLIGELTALTVAEAIETRSVGTVELKGKAEPVRAWEALGARSQRSREEALGALSAPTIGRDAELARLRATSAGLILIVAAPGVGKSRLLAQLAATSDSTILHARVRPQGAGPSDVVMQLLDAAGGDLASALGDAGVPAARAAVVMNEVRRLTEPSSVVPVASADLTGEREARFDAWMTAIDALVDGPSAWLVEDVHWAGGDLLAFLEHAAAAPATRDRLVVATARPSLLESSPAWCERTERMDLDPLPATDAEALIRALVGDALPTGLAAAVVQRSDGTPLFIEELLRTWVSVGTLVRKGGRWHLAVEPGEVALPPTVQAIYAAQIDDLPSDARLLARRGAVAGRRVPVAAFAPLDLSGRDGLDTLRRRAFLHGPMHDPITGEAWAYRHALLRDAAYASLARAERSRLHIAMARWLAATAGDRVDDVAEAVAEHHAMALEALPALGTVDATLDASGLARDAAAWYERAAAASLRVSAVDAARHLLARAIELTAEDAPLDRARRRLGLGEVLAASADLDLGIAELAAAREALSAALPATAAQYERATYALGRAYMQQIRFPEAQAVTQEGIDALGGSSIDPALARLHALHAWSLAANGQPDGVLEEADAALAAATAGDDPVRELEVLEHRTSARDEVDAASPSDWELLEARALALERWHQAVVARRVRAVLMADDDPGAALPLLDSAAELAAAHGLTEQGGWCDYSRCETLWVLGDWDGARAAGERAVDLAERYAYQRLAFRTWMVLLPIAAAGGDAEAVERYDAWWAGAAEHFPPNPSPYGQLLHGAIAVWRAQARGLPITPPPDALVESVIPIQNPHFLWAVLTTIRAWLDVGRTDSAAAAAQRLVEQGADPEATLLVRASAALADAWVSGYAGAEDRAAELAATLPAPRWVTQGAAYSTSPE